MNDIPTNREPRGWRRHLRLSVRALIILALLIGGGVGWTVRNAQRQRAAVTAIRSSGGFVRYDWDHRVSGIPRTQSMMWPEWLESFLGVDYLHGVTWVSTGNGNGLTDAELLRVGDLPQLDFLVISGSRTTDRGLANLGKLKKLKTLTLDCARHHRRRTGASERADQPQDPRV